VGKLCPSETPEGSTGYEKHLVEISTSAGDEKQIKLGFIMGVIP
jgi:hypothetical protein